MPGGTRHGPHPRLNRISSYLINSGMIMMAPLEALRVRDHLEDVGRVWTTDVEVEVSRTKEGLMTFGDVKIVTSEDFEEEDLGEDIDASEFDIGEVLPLPQAWGGKGGSSARSEQHGGLGVRP